MDRFFRKEYGNFLVSLGTEHHCSEAAVQSIVAEFTKLGTLIHTYTLGQVNVNDNNVPNTFLLLKEEFSSSHKISKFVTTSPNYISPVTVPLSQDSQAKKATFQYIPVIKLVEKLVCQEGFPMPLSNAPSNPADPVNNFGTNESSHSLRSNQAASIHDSTAGKVPSLADDLSAESEPASESVFIRDIKDGSGYHENKYFQDNPNALGLILHSDEADPCNALGAARGKHKMLNVYGTFVEFSKAER